MNLASTSLNSPLGAVTPRIMQPSPCPYSRYSHSHKRREDPDGPEELPLADLTRLRE